MNCLFSSIAWLPGQNSDVAYRLRKQGINGIEAAPGLFDRPLADLTHQEINSVRMFWEQEGLPIRAMQALLFGKPNYTCLESMRSVVHFLSICHLFFAWLDN